MTAALVLVPPSRSLIGSSTPIAPGYPKPYTPEQMRAWGDDLARLNRTIEEDRLLPPERQRLTAWLATPRERLAPDARAIVDSYRGYVADPHAGIKGELRPDGRVELTGGRHRAHYLVERGTDPIPVWVSCPDRDQLSRFEARCRLANEPRPRERAATRASRERAR